MLQALVTTVYAYATRGLFNADRLTFALHLAHSFDTSHGAATRDASPSAAPAAAAAAWDALLSGAAASAAPQVDAVTAVNTKACAPPGWLPPELHARYTALTTAHADAAAALATDGGGTWAAWLRRGDAETLPAAAAALPHTVKLLVVQARLCPAGQVKESLLNKSGHLS